MQKGWLFALGAFLVALLRVNKGVNVRQRIVDIALAEIPNPDPDKYWKDVLGPAHQGPYPPFWCGAFDLWAIHQAGVAKDVLWKIGLGAFSVLPTTRNPKPADVAYFTKLQHHALVERVGDGYVDLINGNAAGGAIAKSRVPISQVTVFYSIEPWLKK